MAKANQHLPCPCGTSSDAFSYDKNGWWKCFSCGQNFNEEQLGEGAIKAKVSSKNKAKPKDLLKGEAEAVKSRGLTEFSCKKFQYLKGQDDNGRWCQIAVYTDEFGNPVAQKVRYADKTFRWVGNPSKAVLYGQNLWEGGKRVVVCEGEVDTVTVSQTYGSHRWAVVGLKDGAASAVNDIKNNYEFLLKFDEIVLLFDNDEAGRTAAKKCAEILPVGKAKVGQLTGFKDPNEALIQGTAGIISTSIFEAKSYRPDGIVASADLRAAIGLEETATASISYPWRGLTDMTKGLQLGQLVTIASGSGIGKTTLVSQMALHLHKLGEKVGMVMLEEHNNFTLKRLLSIHAEVNPTKFNEKYETEERLKIFDEVFADKPMYFYDHFGSSDIETILARIRYMAKALDVKWVFLDHLSILVSGLATTDERKLVDVALTHLRTLVAELNIGLVCVTHLRRPTGDIGHEGGAKVSLNQLRSSHSIAQLSDMVIGMNVLKDEPNSDIRELVLLKNRYTGQTGDCGFLGYDRERGILKEIAGNDLFKVQEAY